LFLDLFRGRVVVRALHHQYMTGNARSLAFVLMPDHLHWLLQLEAGKQLSAVIGIVKGYSARELNLMTGSRGPVWQPGFHDHALRREEDLKSLARYIVANPLRAGLVDRIADYPLWDAAWV
jgi:REP element-mobilizing transposase RayT